MGADDAVPDCWKQHDVQIHGAAMGSQVSPIVCNLFMEDLEQRAIATALHPPSWW